MSRTPQRFGLLVVDDDVGLCNQYKWAFPQCEVSIAHARPPALTLAQKDRPAVVVLDLGLPPDPDGVTEGFATLEAITRLLPDTKAIVVTGNGERAHALRAVTAGAYDFCEKPVDIEVLRTIVDRGLRLYEIEAENRRLASVANASSIQQIVTCDESMLKVCRTIERLAATDVTVLLLGESGTGKEALARALHDLGQRARRPFVAINCGAIPETLLESELFGYERGAFTGAHKQTIGKIESADGGTLFLDEIGDIPHPLQVKLLRFLQDQRIERLGGRQPIQVDVRVVSATNAALEDRIQEGRFRGDLFYRLNPVSVRIPPLRQRGGDTVLLARYFLAMYSREFNRSFRGFSDDAIDAMSAHPWPGNVRELGNRVKRAVIMADGKLVTAADLEFDAATFDRKDLDIRAARMRAEREVIQLAMARSNGRLAGAAKLLGISRPTLYTLMDAHGLEAEPKGGIDVPSGSG
ncbi:MAG TPA: PEP-CTERM-box response regulator transcription factor [Acetobacteraceae bacterium]|nr:PEP-CTERM-box response regulator transcription factor [Acetobacteraceae bacterium]